MPGKKKKIPPKPLNTYKVEILAQEKREAKCKGDISQFNKLKREIREQIRVDKKTWFETNCSKIDEFDLLYNIFQRQCFLVSMLGVNYQQTIKNSCVTFSQVLE